jgi:ABC-type uncharacterized transport system ATPase subunit
LKALPEGKESHMSREVLKMENITKMFGDFYANKNINLTICEGEVHTLLGENGAGKSTLMNILVGLYHPTSGRIYLNGEPVHIASPRVAVKYGIGMVHQHFMLVEDMTVFENIILGTKRDPSIFINKEKLKQEILALADRYGLKIEIDKPITEISVGAQQRVEILKALYRGAEILILDEPTAVLTDIEVGGLFEIIRKLQSEKKSIIFISHKMREVLEISDRITILRTGESIKTLDKKDVDAQLLASLMIGSELAASDYEKPVPADGDLLKIDHVSYNPQSKHNGLNQISIGLRKGEILGIAGVDGNGQSQLAQLLTGVIAPEEGEVYYNDHKVDRFRPQAFIEKGIAHIPEDRNKMGLIGNMSVRENLVLKSTETDQMSSGKGFFLKRKAIRMHAKAMKSKFDIRCASVDQESRNLSGGNQQKIVLARELNMKPNVLVAVHPTRGLDIGATRFVHDNMIKARDNGCGVILVSADIDEVLKLSSRIAVMFEGKIVGIYSGINPNLQAISMAMTGKVE